MIYYKLLLFELHADLHSVVAAQQTAQRTDGAVAGELANSPGILQKLADLHDDKQVAAIELSGAHELLHAAGIGEDYILAAGGVGAGEFLRTDSLGEVAVLVEGHFHLALLDSELLQLALQFLLYGSTGDLSANALQGIAGLEDYCRLGVLPGADERVGGGNLAIVED